MHELVEISGILAFISFILAITTGVMKFKFHIKWVNMKWHIWFAILGLIFATTHVVLIVIH